MSSVQPSITTGTPTTQLSSSEPFLSGLNIAPAGGGETAASAPTDRSQYASLFPNDIISGMIQPTATMAEGGAVPPRNVDIKGQDHMLAYITPQEGGILQLLGGSGKAGPMGIPSFFDSGEGGVGGGGYGGAGSAEGTSVSDYSAVDETGQDDDIDYSDSYTDITTPDSEKDTFKENMQRAKEIGRQHYNPVQNVPYDFNNYMQNKMNQHARNSLARGVTPTFSRDNKGNITEVTGPGGPSSGLPGIGSLVSAIGTNLGFSTTTGYAGTKGPDMGSEAPITAPLQPVSPLQPVAPFGNLSALDFYLQNPDRYTLRTK